MLACISYRQQLAIWSENDWGQQGGKTKITQGYISAPYTRLTSSSTHAQRIRLAFEIIWIQIPNKAPKTVINIPYPCNLLDCEFFEILFSFGVIEKVSTSIMLSAALRRGVIGGFRASTVRQASRNASEVIALRGGQVANHDRVFSADVLYRQRIFLLSTFRKICIMCVVATIVIWFPTLHLTTYLVNATCTRSSWKTGKSKLLGKIWKFLSALV